MDIIDDVLSDGHNQSRRSDIKEDIFSLPQVQFVAHVLGVGNEFAPLGAVYPEFVQPNEEHSRNMGQSAQSNPLFQEGSEELPVNVSSNQYVEWLERKSSFVWEIITNQSASLRNNGNEIQAASRILMKLADDLEYLRPGNESHLRYDIKKSWWRIYWNELIAEMKTVEASCSPEIRYSGVYVLTTWPYKDFLRALAAKLCE